jgi:type VI secretion system protein ImpG
MSPYGRSKLTEAQYFSRESAPVDVPSVAGGKAGIRWRLRTTAGLRFSDLSLDRLPIFLRGGGQLALRLYEQLLGSAVAMIVKPTTRESTWQHIGPPSEIRRVGFEDQQALFPSSPLSFQGYRLLHEYFAFPQRFMFVELGGLREAVVQCDEQELDIVVLFSRTDPILENALDVADFALYCTPAINLFSKRTDRVHLDPGKFEFHIVPDRTRPMDFELHSVNRVLGHGTSSDEEQEFLPFYAINDLTNYGDHRAYYSLIRRPRVLSARQKLHGPRSSYIGSETFISLVDSSEAPYRHQLRQLSFQTLCTNRDLPLHIPIGKGVTDFTMESGAPVQSVRCLAGPTKPKPALGYAAGETSWRLISHLSLNYLTLMDHDERQGAAALRELLKLYADTSEAPIQQQLEGIRSISSTPVMRRIPTTGPMAFGRGQQVTVTCDESAFEGSGVFLLGAVLERFFAKYVSINSFTETVIKTVDRGEVMRWPIRIGQRHII